MSVVAVAQEASSAFCCVFCGCPRTHGDPAGSKPGKSHLLEKALTWCAASSFGDGSLPNLADTPRDSSVCQGPGADLTHRAHEGGPRNHPEAWVRVLGPPYACPLLPLRDHSQPGELGQTAPLLVSSSPSVEWEAWSERCASLLQNLTPPTSHWIAFINGKQTHRRRLTSSAIREMPLWDPTAHQCKLSIIFKCLTPAYKSRIY